MVKCNFQHPATWLLALAFQPFFGSLVAAQSCGFSDGKTLHELQIAVQAPDHAVFSAKLLGYEKLTFTQTFTPSSADAVQKHGIFLPQWSAADLPFFCKIEHDWAKNRARVPVKFRLGSVDYVDWLEGKSWDKLRY